MKAKSLFIIVSAILIAGCATLGTGFAARDFERAVAIINSQDAGGIIQNTSAPFVFESEMLLRQSDVEAVWSHLSENGFELVNPIVTETNKIDDSTYRVFSESEEMRIFFSKYIPKGSALGRVDTDNGTFYLLIGRGADGYSAILGITGW
jgi:hypothetical protein